MIVAVKVATTVHTSFGTESASLGYNVSCTIVGSTIVRV